MVHHVGSIGVKVYHVETRPNDQWTGYPDPTDPDNYWIDDATGERIKAV